MALICCGVEKDEYGRPVCAYIDTDDLDDAEYHYFRKAEELRNKIKQAQKVARLILTGKLKAYEIEKNPEYGWLTDDLSELVRETKEAYNI